MTATKILVKQEYDVVVTEFQLAEQRFNRLCDLGKYQEATDVYNIMSEIKEDIFRLERIMERQNQNSPL